MLEQFGFTETEESLYFALVDVPDLTAGELASLVRSTSDEIPVRLDRLRSAGLISQRDGCPPRYSAVDPDLALAPLIATHGRQLERARIAARRLGQKFRAARPGRDPLDVVEVVLDARARSECVSHLRHLAQSELRGIDKSPDLDTDDHAGDHGAVTAATGVRVRNIYDRAALAVPGVVDRILNCRTAREQQVRVISEAPFQLRLADDRLAVLFLGRPRVVTGRCPRPAPVAVARRCRQPVRNPLAVCDSPAPRTVRVGRR